MMTCLLQLYSKVYAMGVVVADGSSPTNANSRVGCATLCVYKTSCSSFFFNGHTGSCHLHTRWINNLVLDPAGNVNYYVVYPDACQFEGYQFIRRSGMCIKIASDKKTWTQAKAACESDGARLVKIDTADKMWDISDILVAEHPGNPFFIGASDPSKNNSWQWTDGTAVEQYWWNPNEPSDYPTEDCLKINQNYPRWNDDICGNHRDYICEKL
ncbi:C-type Lectin CRL-like [Gigantopelta aegis]|uniref:C-type Lectin CRL-like n=1 Tax=Gigantopelta aegis TaxID=1735272 RepID=UPI001B889DC1|nr:C-type Lectin CRL-like [Gigantopelta aegis]